MPFNKQEVINLIKLPLDATERKREGEIELAFRACVDDMADRMQSINQVRKQETTLTIGTRTTTLTGLRDDLKKVWFLKYGTGDSQEVLEYIPPEQFLRDYDNPDADADVPEYWTILRTVNGFPEIKFDVPTDASDTLVVYYFSDPATEANVVYQSGVALSEGALGYFYGLESDQGRIHYAAYEKLVALRRAADDFKHFRERKFGMGQDDRDIMDTIHEYGSGRY